MQKLSFFLLLSLALIGCSPAFLSAQSSVRLATSSCSFANFSHDGKIAFVRSYEGDWGIFDTRTGSKLGVFEEVSILEADFHPAGKYMGILLADGTVQYYDASGEKTVFEWKEPTFEENFYRYGPVIGFDATGNRLAFPADGGKSIKVAETASGKIVASIAFETPFASLSLSPDGKYLAASIEDGSKVYEVSTGKAVAHLEPENGHSFLVWTADVKKVLATGITGGPCRVFEFPSGKLLGNIDGVGTAADLNPVDVYENRVYLPTYKDDYAVFAFDLSSLEQVETYYISHEFPTAIQILPQTGKLAVISEDGLLSLFSLQGNAKGPSRDPGKAAKYFESGYEAMAGFFYEKAFRDYQTGYQYDQGNIRANTLLAYLYTQSENETEWKTGMKMLQELLANPGKENLLINIVTAKILMESQRYEQAAITFEKVLRIAEPGQAGKKIYFYLGKCKEMQGLKQEAIEYYEKAIASDYGESRLTEFFLIYEDEMLLPEKVKRMKAGH